MEFSVESFAAVATPIAGALGVAARWFLSQMKARDLEIARLQGVIDGMKDQRIEELKTDNERLEKLQQKANSVERHAIETRRLRDSDRPIKNSTTE